MPIIPVHLTHEELASLCSAVNEALECVDDSEFETRLGRSRAEIEALLRRLQGVLAEG